MRPSYENPSREICMGSFSGFVRIQGVLSNGVYYFDLCAISGQIYLVLKIMTGCLTIWGVGVYTPVTWVSHIWLSEAFVTMVSVQDTCRLISPWHPPWSLSLSLSRFFFFFFFADVPRVVQVSVDFVTFCRWLILFWVHCMYHGWFLGVILLHLNVIFVTPYFRIVYDS